MLTQTINLQSKIEEKSLAKFKFRCHYLKNIIAPIYNEYTKDTNTLDQGILLTESQQAIFEKAKAKNFVNLNKGETFTFKVFKKKSDELTAIKNKVDNFDYQTSYNRLYHIASEEILDIKQLLLTKSVTRGIDQEDESIQLVNNVLGLKLKKNEKRFESGFFSGVPDILYKDSVIDIKTCETKASFDTKTLKMAMDDYFWQLYGYKRLTKASKYFIVYVLPSYPEKVIKKVVLNHFNRMVSFEEADYYYNSFKIHGLDKTIEQEPTITKFQKDKITSLFDIYNQEFNNHNYDRLPENTRVKVFQIDGLDKIKDNIVDKILEKSREDLVSIASQILQPLDTTNIQF